MFFLKKLSKIVLSNKKEIISILKEMKPKKSSGAFREDKDSLKGKRKPKLTPIKKQKSKKTQFLDEIEEFEGDEFDFKNKDLEDLYEEIDDDLDEDDDDLY